MFPSKIFYSDPEQIRTMFKSIFQSTVPFGLFSSGVAYYLISTPDQKVIKNMRNFQKFDYKTQEMGMQIETRKSKALEEMAQLLKKDIGRKMSKEVNYKYGLPVCQFIGLFCSISFAAAVTQQSNFNSLTSTLSSTL